MIDIFRINLVRFVGIAVCMLVAGMVAPMFTSARGAASPLVLGSEAGIVGIVAVILLVLGVAAVGGGIGRWLTPTSGMLIAGFGVGVLAWRMGTVTELGLLGREGLVVPEALLFAGLAFGAVMIVHAIAGPVRDVEPNAAGVHPHGILSGAAMKSAAGCLAVIPVVLLIAASAVKGQVLGTAILAGVFAGLASRLVSPHVQPILIYPATVLGGLLAFLIGGLMLDAPFESAAALKRLPALVRPLPVDYLAGSLIGVSIGLSWATSFLHHEEPVGKPSAEPA
jgi:hypothetical protein